MNFGAKLTSKIKSQKESKIWKKNQSKFIQIKYELY